MLELVDQIRRSEGCIVLPPLGMPRLEDRHQMPDDLHEFYSICGGIVFFRDSDYSIEIVKSENFILSNPEILSDVLLEEIPKDDISYNWYIVAQAGIEQRISIDLSEKRLGRCYDSFWDIHASPGESPVLAMSFTELLERIFECRGGYWYWLADGFENLGDAYD